MGRQKRPFPLGHFIIKRPKNFDKNKAYPICIEYAFSGKPIKRPMGINVPLSEWNPDGNQGRGEIRASFPDSARFNKLLLQRVNEVDAQLNDYHQKNPGQVNAEVIAAFLDNKPITRRDKGEDFVTFILNRLKSESERNKIGYSRHKNGVSVMKGFTDFLKATENGTYRSDAIYVGDISVELLQKYINWRREFRGNSDETINHALTPILKGCDYACSKGLIDLELNAALQDMRIQVKPSLESDTEKEFDGNYLTKEQMIKLLDFYQNDNEPRRKEYIEMFLFAFHACGLRIVDVMTLQWGHIDFQKKELTKVLVKTSRLHKIPLTEPALRILRKWQAMGRRSKFVFDLVKDTLSLNDPEAIYSARNSATKKVNQALNVIGEKLELPFSFSFHVSRHTFAVHAINDGMALNILSRLLGHASTDVTEKVYAKILPQTLTSEVERLGYSFLPSNFS